MAKQMAQARAARQFFRFVPVFVIERNLYRNYATFSTSTSLKLLIFAELRLSCDNSNAELRHIFNLNKLEIADFCRITPQL